MKDRNGERRHQDKLRAAVERECAGVMPHIADRIKRAARTAYYLGVSDGMAVTGALVCDNTLSLRKEVNHG